MATRASIETARPQDLIAEGRMAEALQALRDERRGRRGANALQALWESECLLALARPREAAQVCAASRLAPEADVRDRLTVQRARLGWLAGAVGTARREAEGVASRAVSALTRCRAHELLCLVALRRRDLDRASAELKEAAAEAAQAEEGPGRRHAESRLAGLEAETLRARGDAEQALELLARRLTGREVSGRADDLALALAERGDLLASLGRWTEARRDLERAGALFHRLGDAREATLAGVHLAAVDIFTGAFAVARPALEEAMAVLDAEGDPRGVAEVDLLLSDLYLATGEAAQAEEHARRAAQVFTRVDEGEGVSRALVRRAHAAVAGGRAGEALHHARRSLRGVLREDLRALAELACGRALLRIRPGEAVGHLEAARGGRPGIAGAARLGLALAAGAGREHPEVLAALEELTAFGDRRLLYLCEDDLVLLRGGVPQLPRPAVAADARVADVSLAALGGAALALDGGEGHVEGWARAVREVRRALPWVRAALVAGEAYELRSDGELPRPLDVSDPARLLAAGLAEPARVDLSAEPFWRTHPKRRLFGLGTALLAPAGPGAVVYLDFPEGYATDDRQLCLLAQLGSLVAARLPEQDALGEAAPSVAGILGRCPGMQRLFADVEALARTDLPVHLHGESGTGKERVARALHDRSTRASGPFVALNAAAIPRELFESELFGSVRGAFTGASADRRGFVAAAEGGTLFLDEITEMPPEQQPKLLRFLESREYCPVGEPRARRADVRIVTASNRPLETCVAEGRFRADLVYRFVHRLDLPPLRDRGGDLRLLARHFLRLAAEKLGRRPPQLPEDVARALEAHSWPGNVRELAGAMERLLLRAGEGPLRVADLPEQVRGGRRAEGTGTLREARRAHDRERVRAELERHGGNRTRAARALGVSRQALVASIPRLGL